MFGEKCLIKCISNFDDKNSLALKPLLGKAFKTSEAVQKQNADRSYPDKTKKNQLRTIVFLLRK